MTGIPEVQPLTSHTPAAMLMAILDVMESPAMVEAVEEAGGVNRPHGVRKLGWELRFKANHLGQGDDWMAELDHAVTHVMAAADADALQAALRTTAAIAASWALALEVQVHGGGS